MFAFPDNLNNLKVTLGHVGSYVIWILKNYFFFLWEFFSKL